jgi:hypothetical protein
MLQQRVIYLINAEIDGELEPAEITELESILESSDEARKMQAELRKLTKLMEDEPEQMPPADLASRIVGQITLPAPRQATEPSLPAKWSPFGWLASFQPAQAGVAFAAGLLLTVAFYEAAQHDGAPADLSSMVGTMVADPSSLPAREKDSLPITGPGVSGSVSLGEIGEYVVLSFDLESEQQTEIEVGLAEAGLGFGGIAHASVAGNAGDETYEVSGGALRVVNQGRQVFSVFLPQVADPTADRATGQDGGGREISIGISAQGAPVFSGVLRG